MANRKRPKPKSPLPIYQRIEHFRKLLGITQYEMAAKIKMSGGNYGKIERGEIGVPFDTLERIANACKIPITTLISERSEELERLIAEKDAQIVELQKQVIHLLKDKK